jgi:hypothetical protein
MIEPIAAPISRFSVAVFKVDDAQSTEQTQRNGRRSRKTEGLRNPGCTRQGDRENRANEDDIQKITLFLLDVDIEF